MPDQHTRWDRHGAETDSIASAVIECLSTCFVAEALLCVLYLVGTRSLPTFEIPEMIELGEQMFSHLVRWANLGVAMPDGTLPKTSSIVWCSAQTLPDLSGWRSDKSYAREAVSSDRDEYSNRPVSPARRARGHALRTALVLLFLGSARADSTSVDPTSSGTTRVKTVETDVPRSKRGALKAQRPDSQLADFVDEGLEASHVDAYPTDQRLKYQEKLKPEQSEVEGKVASK